MKNALKKIGRVLLRVIVEIIYERESKKKNIKRRKRSDKESL